MIRTRRSVAERRIARLCAKHARTPTVSARGDAATGQHHGLVRHLALAAGALLRNRLDHVPVTVTGRKIHPRVHPARVFAQRVLDHAHGLDKRAPVQRTQQAQAADAVADRHLVGGLLLILCLNRLLDRHAVFGELLLDPRQRQGERGAAMLEATHEPGDEGAAHGRVRARHVGQHQDQALGVGVGGLGDAVRTGVGQIALGAGIGHPHAGAAQALDEREAQHDRNGPQLAQFECADGLVRGDEAAQLLGIDPAIAVRHDLEHEVVDARLPGRWPIGQARQADAVAARQVSPCGADLFLDEVKVVEQPFSRRRDAAILGGGRGEPPRGVDECMFVGGQPRQQAVRTRARRELVGGGKSLAVLHHLLAAEQLRAQGWLGFGRLTRSGAQGRKGRKQGAAATVDDVLEQCPRRVHRLLQAHVVLDRLHTLDATCE
jgi:hypothetical protein